MVRLRLARRGCKKSPFYHIVAINSRSARDGRFIEKVGFFNPVIQNNSNKLYINLDRIMFWLSKGAQPSGRVKFLIEKQKRFVKKFTYINYNVDKK